MPIPSANWLSAASKYGETPILVFQIPSKNYYFASWPGHYSNGAASEPYHAGLIKKGGMPVITREISGVFEGRMIVKIGSTVVVDTGAWDGGFGDYQNTLRGAILDGYVTFPGLAWADAVQYLTARIIKLETNDKSQMTLTLDDAANEDVANAWLTEYAPGSSKLSVIIQNRLEAAGVTPFDSTKVDMTAWNAWKAVGKPGDLTVTVTAKEGECFDVLETLLKGTLSVFGFKRDGLFFIQQFADLGGAPTVDVDLTTTDSILRGGSLKIYEPVIKKESVKYSAGASQVDKEITAVQVPAPDDVWLDTAKENSPVDVGINGVPDATLLCADRLLFMSAEHAKGETLADSRMLAYDLCDVVKHNFADHLLPNIAPVNHQIFKIEEDPNKGKHKLGLWVGLGATPQP